MPVKCALFRHPAVPNGFVLAKQKPDASFNSSNLEECIIVTPNWNLCALAANLGYTRSIDDPPCCYLSELVHIARFLDERLGQPFIDPGYF